MKFLKSASATILFVLSTSVNASFINYGTFTTDTAERIDWLNLSQTSNATMADSLSSNSGWRYATNLEVENLFNVMFDGFYVNTSRVGISTSIYDETSPYPGHYEDLYQFNNLFGACLYY